MNNKITQADKGRKFFFSTNIFNTIDDKDKAYWLGFIFGDGSISRSSLRIEISNKDIDHLHKFKKFMSFNGQIVPTRKNCSLLCMSSVVMVQDLLQYGLQRPKVLVTPNIDERFMSHFYRGFFDADGWITAHKSKKSKKSYEYGFCCANKDFLIDIKTFISQSIGKDCGYLTLHTNPLGSVQQLIFGGNTMFPKITNILYDNANYYLDRKYKTMSDALNMIQNTPDGRTTRWQK